MLSSGARGLILQFDGSEEGTRIRVRALEFGFSEAGKSGALKLFPKEPGKFYFSPEALAESLGGIVTEIPRLQWESVPWTIRLRREGENRFGPGYFDCGGYWDQFAGRRSVSRLGTPLPQDPGRRRVPVRTGNSRCESPRFSCGRRIERAWN